MGRQNFAVRRCLPSPRFVPTDDERALVFSLVTVTPTIWSVNASTMSRFARIGVGAEGRFFPRVGSAACKGIRTRGRSGLEVAAAGPGPMRLQALADFQIAATLPPLQIIMQFTAPNHALQPALNAREPRKRLDVAFCPPRGCAAETIFIAMPVCHAWCPASVDADGRRMGVDSLKLIEQIARRTRSLGRGLVRGKPAALFC
jgi:hypothetical protein